MSDNRPSVADLKALIKAQEDRDEVSQWMHKITENPEVWSKFLQISFKNEGREIVGPNSLLCKTLARLLAPRLSELSLDSLQQFVDVENQARAKVGL